MRLNWTAVRNVAPVVISAALLAACATVRNPALEQAHDAYQKARQDPMIVRHAGASLDRARQTLDAADRIWADERDVAEVDHLAYIAEKRIEIARTIAQRRSAADEIQPPTSARP